MTIIFFLSPISVFSYYKKGTHILGTLSGRHELWILLTMKTAFEKDSLRWHGCGRNEVQSLNSFGKLRIEFQIFGHHISSPDSVIISVNKPVTFCTTSPRILPGPESVLVALKLKLMPSNLCSIAVVPREKCTLVHVSII